MLSKLKNSFKWIKNSIKNTVSDSQNLVKNTVLAILISAWSWIATKANANLQINYQSQNTYHKVVKNDTLYKLSIKYWIKINDLKKLNNIWSDNIIHLWETLIIEKNNTLNIDKTKNIIKKHVSKIQSKKKINNNESKIVEKTDISKKYKKKEIINNPVNIKLTRAIRYSAMYQKIWEKFKKTYTISPSDTPYFTWKVKILSWKVYAEIRLENDHNFTWYTRLSAFGKESRKLINDYYITNNKSEKNNKVLVKTEPKKNINIAEKKIRNKQKETINKLTNEELIEKSFRNTLKWSVNKKNPINIDLLSKITLTKNLYKLKRILGLIKNEEQKKKYIKNYIYRLSVDVDYKKINDNMSSADLYDHYATMERMKISTPHFIEMNEYEFYKNYVVAKFWWDWNKAEKIITKKLWLKESLFNLNPRLKLALEKWRKQWRDKLLNFIIKLESKWNYNAVFWNYNQNKVKYVEMTIQEVIKQMRYRINKKITGSSATWIIQVVQDTLERYCKSKKIDIKTQLFDQKFQRKLAIALLEERWINKYLNNELKRDKFQINLSQEWASLAKDHTNKSFYHLDWKNKALSTNKEIDELLDNLKNPQINYTSNLVKNNQKPDLITSRL